MILKDPFAKFLQLADIDVNIASEYNISHTPDQVDGTLDGRVYSWGDDWSGLLGAALWTGQHRYTHLSATGQLCYIIGYCMALTDV